MITKEKIKEFLADEAKHSLDFLHATGTTRLSPHQEEAVRQMFMQIDIYSFIEKNEKI